MNNTLNQQSSHWRYLWLFALLGLPALGWYGILDDLSSRDINHSISNAGLFYGTARGINALVSLLQGTELNLLVMTFSIGEVLDPINDLIERFSDVVLWALGSLALQKILLALVSQKLFNILLSGVAVLAGVSLFIGSPKLLRTLLRTFLVIAFFRFSLGLVVLANSWVDTAFLDDADQERHIALETFRGELSQIDNLSKKADEATARVIDAQGVLIRLQVHKNDSQQALQELNVTIQDMEQRLKEAATESGRLCAISISTPLPSPTCSDSVKKLGVELDGQVSKKEHNLEELASLEVSIEELQEKMGCLEKRQRGESCHFWEDLPYIPNVALLRNKMKEIEVRVSGFTENVVDLMMSLLLKTIAIPLLFIYVLLKIVRTNWAKI